MHYVYGVSGPSLLIESTDSMILSFRLRLQVHALINQSIWYSLFSLQPHAYYASKDKPSAVLPPFPDVSSLELSDSVPKEKLHTFMVMYRAHCQRVLDSIVRATFDEVGESMQRSW